MNEDNNVSNNEIQIFKNFLLINHRNNKITNLILPILYIKDIPHDIICKYFLRAYTLETNFYKEMNRLLMKQSGNHYHTFIKVLYEGLFNESITKSLDACLYRGTKMNHNEIDKIIKLYNEWKTKGDKSIPSFLLYSRCFLSFTKDEDQIGIFIKKQQNEEKCYSIEFILNNNENLINNLSSNADLGFISAIKKEKEVLFFPFSCFCVENITKGKFKDIDCIKINLNYLGKYSAMINDIIKEKNFSIDYIDTFNEQNYVKEIIKSNIILPSNNENKENKILNKIETKIEKKFNKKINFENENKNKETNEKKLIFPVINSEEKIILDEKDNKNKINDDINKDKDSTNLLNIIIEQRKKENKNYFFYFTSLKPSQIEYIWKGEYNKSNKKHGKGKDYDFDDNIIFEGIYENGSRKNGIEYYIIGTKRYEGEYKNKLRWNGIFYDIDMKYKYEIKNGNGYIKEFYENGCLKYEGDIKEGKKNGKGKIYDECGHLIYEGNFENNIKKGIGKIYNYSGDLIFEGEIDNEKQIKGNKYIYNSFGELINKNENGKIIDFKSKRLFINDRMIQNCVWVVMKNKKYKLGNDFPIFEGEYKDGKYYKGKEYNYNSKLIFEGEYKDGKKWNGIFYNPKNNNNSGNLINGNGIIQEYNYDGKLIFEGEYKDCK